MKSIFKQAVAVALLLSAPLVVTAAAAKPAPPPPGVERTAPWNAETSDLEPDKSVIYGRLPNGLIYAIRPNNRPQNRVIIRMALDFGSAAEADDEQGLAHFIEHMAFNGSTNVPEGEMVKMLERLGLAFGADTNASTGYTQTTYKLNLPRADMSLIERALFLMRETASEVTFDPGAVKRERGVVVAEMRQREGFGFQARRARNNFLYPDSYFSTRYAIGKRGVIDEASAAKMRALYDKWYRPDRARIVIVGPVDPVAMEKMIAAKFSNWQNNAPPLGKIDQCRFDDRRVRAAAQFTHPKLTESVTIMQLVADKPRRDTFNRALLQLKMQIAGAIIAGRMARLSRGQDIPYLGSKLIFEPSFCDRYARIGFAVSGKDGSSEALLPIVEQKIRQAAEHGFTAQEVAEQIRRRETAFANAAKGADTRRSAAFANALVGLGDNVLNDPKYLQLVWLSAKPFMTADAISAEFARWHGRLDRPLIFGQAKTASDPGKLLTSYTDSLKVAVAAPEERSQKDFAYTDFGAVGKVAENSLIADLGIRTIRFSNNVLLNIKKTNFEDNRIRFSIRIAGGELAFGKDNAALSSLMNSAFISGGLEAHDLDELRSIFAGTTVQSNLWIRDEYFGGGGSVSPADLEKQMQLLAAYITHPGYRNEALRLYRRPLEERYARLDATPGTALNIAYNRILTGNDPRFSLASLETAKALDFDQLKMALGNMLLENRLEIALVGDLDEDAAIAAVAKTFGALPKRKIDADPRTDARKTEWSADMRAFEILHKGEKDQLSWRRTWTTADGKDQKLDFTMDLLARVISIRLLDELREKLGASYGGRASSYMSDVYPGRGTFSISTSGDPKDLTAIEQAVDLIVVEITAAPVDTDLFERAKKPRLESYRDWRQHNGTWIGVASRAQTRGDRLARFRSGEDVFKSITRGDVHKAAIRFLKDRKSYIFHAVPAEQIASGESEAAKAP
ncbi:MAG: insulinase family protein [Sphingorhabdus sp.]